MVVVAALLDHRLPCCPPSRDEDLTSTLKNVGNVQFVEGSSEVGAAVTWVNLKGFDPGLPRLVNADLIRRESSINRVRSNYEEAVGMKIERCGERAMGG